MRISAEQQVTSDIMFERLRIILAEGHVVYTWLSGNHFYDSHFYDCLDRGGFFKGGQLFKWADKHGRPTVCLLLHHHCKVYTFARHVKRVWRGCAQIHMQAGLCVCWNLLRSWVLILKEIRNLLSSLTLILSNKLPNLSIPDVPFPAPLTTLIRR
jgi:hypothetical protein